MPFDRRFPCLVAFAFAFALVVTAPLVRKALAQEAPTTTSAPVEVPADDLSTEKLAALGTSSPRGAVYMFITAVRAGDYDSAAAHLNLTNLPATVRDRDGADLARDLHVVLDRALWIEWETLSPEARGFSDDGLPRSQDLLGTIETKSGRIEILVEQATWSQGKPVWKIANESVAKIPELYGELGYGPLGQFLPRALVERSVLDVRLWQWIALALVFVLAGLLGIVFARISTWLLRTVVARTRADADDRLAELSPGPLRLLIFALVLTLAVPPLGLAVPVFRFLSLVTTGLMIIAGIWLLMRLTDVGATMIERQLLGRGQAIAMSIVPLGRRATKIVLAAIAILVILQNFGFNVAGLIAGLGIGGLAFALAAQKSLENLFGGVTLIADRPVQVGDFCRFGDRIGTVEEVGLRSTRVRTLDRTVVSIPNAEFANMQIENFARRDRIWFHPTIGVRYETTPDQMRFLLIELKKLLVGHPKVLADPARVRFTGLGAFSLDIEIFAYVATPDFNEYLAVQEDLLLRIIDVVDRSGTGFAFPSQTIYAAKDEGLDTQRQQDAMAEIARLREAGGIGLPNFRAEQLAAMTGTLAYPDVGSALRPPPNDSRGS
jgi:MscS family membrane protein